tara:strand:+ start:464 stop:841 length:378 start_codon:yes stop_codon:yes gene_type:complete
MILTKSDSTSFQSISENKIECCICLEEINNENSFMTNCKHSWCIECNEKLNKENISDCPICKRKFDNYLLNGKWIFYKNSTNIYQWKWEKGINDSKKLKKIRKVQTFLYNLIYLYPSNGYSIHSV